MTSENEPKSVFQLISPADKRRSDPIACSINEFRKFVMKERDARMVNNPDDGVEFHDYIVIHVGDIVDGELRITKSPLISVDTFLNF